MIIEEAKQTKILLNSQQDLSNLSKLANANNRISMGLNPEKQLDGGVATELYQIDSVKPSVDEHETLLDGQEVP